MTLHLIQTESRCREWKHDLYSTGGVWKAAQPLPSRCLRAHRAENFAPLDARLFLYRQVSGSQDGGWFLHMRSKRCGP
jgi:hypothetical protein